MESFNVLAEEGDNFYITNNIKRLVLIRMKVLAVGSPILDGTGGEKRNFMTLSQYADFGIKAYLHFPYSKLVWAVVNKDKRPELLENLRRTMGMLQERKQI